MSRRSLFIKPSLRLAIFHWRPIELLTKEEKAFYLGRGAKLRYDKKKKKVYVLIGYEEKDSDIVVNDGLDYLCDAVGNPTYPGRMGYTAIGTDPTAPSPTDTALGAEVMRTSNTYSKDVPVGEASLDAEFTIDATYDLNECALFNADVGGTMFCRDTYSTRSVVAGDIVRIYYTLSFVRY